MSRQLVALIDDQLVEHQIASADRPGDPNDGVSIMSWRQNGEYSAPLACLFFKGTVAAVVSMPTDGDAGPELWGYRLEQWWRIGYINNGTDVAIAGALQGLALSMNIIGVFERLCVAGTVSAGVVTVKIAPIDSWTTA